MIVARCWIVRGRVQGVGFRWAVRRRAEALGLTGFARNLNDGAVEVVARGEAQALDEMEKYLSIGPRMAAVESVENRGIPHDISITNSFDIK